MTAKTAFGALLVATFTLGSSAALAGPALGSPSCGGDKKEEPKKDGDEASVPSCGEDKEEPKKDGDEASVPSCGGDDKKKQDDEPSS
jgi:hypothetical protein